MRKRLHPAWFSVDIVLALLVTAIGQVEAWTVDLEGGSRPVVVLATLAATSVLALRRRRPAVSAVVVMSAVLAKDALGGSADIVTLLLCGVVTVFGVGAWEPSPRSERTLPLLLAISAAAALLGDFDALGELLFSAIAVGGPWGAGRLVRDRTERAAMLEELASRRARDAEAQAALAAAEERTRIARELHDLVGHSVSLMVLQAGAAEQILLKDPVRADAALRSIQETGRGAIDELRRVVGLLREAGQPHEIGPLPGMGQLDPLLERIRDAGVRVDVEIDGDPIPLPEGIGLAAYRIVQEALTNVVKHARGASARVRVSYRGDQLSIEVADEGGAAANGNPSGHGLVGIRERVALYGGRLEVGPQEHGGFRVAAELPLARHGG